jgi:hypothetical protein
MEIKTYYALQPVAKMAQLVYSCFDYSPRLLLPVAVSNHKIAATESARRNLLASSLRQ